MQNLQALVLLSLGWTWTGRYQIGIISKPLALFCNAICCIGGVQYKRRVVAVHDVVKSFWLGRRDCSQTLCIQRKEFTAQIVKISIPAWWLFLTRSNRTKLEQTRQWVSPAVVDAMTLVCLTAKMTTPWQRLMPCLGGHNGCCTYYAKPVLPWRLPRPSAPPMGTSLLRSRPPSSTV